MIYIMYFSAILLYNFQEIVYVYYNNKIRLYTAGVTASKILGH